MEWQIPLLPPIQPPVARLGFASEGRGRKAFGALGFLFKLREEEDIERDRIQNDGIAECDHGPSTPVQVCGCGVDSRHAVGLSRHE